MEGAKEPSKETVDLPSPPASESAPPQQAETIGAKDVEMVDAGAPSVAGGASTGQPEEPVFREEVDCEEDNRAKVNVDCKFGAFDSTLDTNFDDTNGIISSYSTEGFQYLLSGVRANVGAKPGSKHNFVFEVRIVEVLSVLDSPCNAQAHIPPHRHLLRVGFSTADGGLLLGSSDLGVGFDSGLDHRMYAPGTSAAPTIIKGTHIAPNVPTAAFGLNDVVAVVLNLDESKEHGNTISLFKNGVRAGPPVKLPEKLIGEELYPTITFKNVRVEANLGYKADDPRMTDMSPFGGLLVPLPFKIRSFQQSSANDVCINPWYTSNNDHPEAVMVIGLPDEGVFDYVDYFLEQNPHKYVELSERTMFDWFKASALRPIRRGPVASNDRPDFLFGVQPFDEGFVRKQLREFARMPHGRKNLVLVEIRGGLLEEERSKIMEQFPGRERNRRDVVLIPSYDFSVLVMFRTAVVCVGKPAADYTAYVKDIVRGEIFAEKELERERKLNVLKHEYKIRQMERERAKKVREAARAAERARIEAAEDARKKREEAAAATAKEAGDEGKDEAKTEEDDQKMQPAPVEEKKEEAPKEEAEEEEEEPEPTLPPTEVTDEEIKQRLRVENVEDSRTANLVREEQLSEGCYRKMPFSDISHKALSECYLSFTLPQETEKTPRGLQAFDSINFVWEKKAAATQRLEAWVKSHKVLEKVPSITGPTDWFKQQMEAWMNTKLEWRKAQRLYQEEQAKARSEKKEEQEEEEKGEEKKTEGPDEKMEDAPAEVDVWVPEDVCDIDAKKTPLFAKFQLVDWQLMNLCYELHLLCHAFERDATSQDADLKGIHKSLLQHYYQTYVMRGVLVPSLYGAHSLDQILDTLLVDTIMIDKDGVLKAVHDIDAPLSTFVRLTEAARREREARIAAGDESAKLMVIQPVVSHYSGGKGGGRRVDYSRSGKGGYQSYQQHSGPYHARYNPASGRGPVGGQYQRGYQSGGKGYANGGPQQQQYYAYKRPYDIGAYDPSKRQKGGPLTQYYQGGKGYSRPN